MGNLPKSLLVILYIDIAYPYSSNDLVALVIISTKTITGFEQNVLALQFNFLSSRGLVRTSKIISPKVDRAWVTFNQVRIGKVCKKPTFMSFDILISLKNLFDEVSFDVLTMSKESFRRSVIGRSDQFKESFRLSAIRRSDTV